MCNKLKNKMKMKKEDREIKLREYLMNLEKDKRTFRLSHLILFIFMNRGGLYH